MESAKYDRIGKNYNRTRTADPYLLAKMIEFLRPHPGGHYIDVGCGSGNYTSAIHKTGIKITGVDPSQEMLEKAHKTNPEIEWCQGVAENIPMANEVFDGALACLTIHHWTDLYKSFLEINRIIKPSSEMVIFTSTPIQMSGYWLNHFFPEMMKASINQMPSFEKVEKSLLEAGFVDIRTEAYYVRNDLKDKFLYSGKNDPMSYLNPLIRQGISSFADLSLTIEVQSGLSSLNQDIVTGEIKRIIQEYENSHGDYLFIIARKP